MATTLAEAVVVFAGDDSQLDKDLGAAEKKTSNAVGNMAKIMGGALVGAAAAAGAAVIGIGASAFSMAQDVDNATDQIGASLGLSEENAKKFGVVIKTVYGNNFGESIEDVGAAVENVAKQLKLTADGPELRTMTEHAFRLRDVFGVEVADSVDAVSTLMSNFGITAQEAFDYVAEGYRVGLDRSGDFLDTIGEYSVQFAEGGASVTEFFSALDTGLQGGMLGTDKAADAFKEFRVRIQDGSKLTADSLTMIGLSADEITTGLASGAITVKDAWDLVQRGLQTTTDSAVQFQAGVGLIGTQFEDLGAKVILGMDLTNDWAEGGIRSVTELDSKYTSLGAGFEGMWRQFQVGIAPAGEAILALANEYFPAIQDFVTNASGTIADFITYILPGFEKAAKEVAEAVIAFFAWAAAAITEVRIKWDADWAGMKSTVDTFVKDTPDALAGMWAEINNLFDREGEEVKINWESILKFMMEAAVGWNTFIIAQFTLMLKGLNLALDNLGALLSYDWETLWDGITELFETFAEFFLNMIEVGFGPDVRDAFVQAMHDAWDGMREVFDDIKEWWDNAIGGLFNNTPDFESPVPQSMPSPPMQITPPNWPQNPESSMGPFASSTNMAAPLAGTTNNITVNLANGGYDQGFLAGDGVLDAMHFQGIG